MFGRLSVAAAATLATSAAGLLAVAGVAAAAVPSAYLSICNQRFSSSEVVITGWNEDNNPTETRPFTVPVGKCVTAPGRWKVEAMVLLSSTGAARYDFQIPGAYADATYHVTLG